MSEPNENVIRAEKSVQRERSQKQLLKRRLMLVKGGLLAPA